MNNEYCVIYGCSDTNPGPFILAVSKDQTMINGFREEHYHICKGGTIYNNNNNNKYDMFAGDYEITYYMGHYMTQKMITEFCEYCTSVYNSIYGMTDIIERDLSYVKFNAGEQEIVDNGFTLLLEIMSNITPIEINELMDGHVYGEVLNIEKCLDRFLSNYVPEQYF